MTLPKSSAVRVMPETLSLSDFLGDFKISSVDSLGEHLADMLLREAVCVGVERYIQGDYSFFVALHRRDPKQNEEVSARCGKDLIVVRHKSIPVGLNAFSMTYVKKEHRGQGLGAELNVQLYLLAGSTTWRRRPPDTLTRANLSCLKRAYKTLLDRGFIHAPLDSDAANRAERGSCGALSMDDNNAESGKTV